MTYAEFKTKYQSGYGLTTSTKLKDAYRQYQLSGTLPKDTTGTTAGDELPEGFPLPETYETMEDWYAATGQKPPSTYEEWQKVNPEGTKEEYLRELAGTAIGAIFPGVKPTPTEPTTPPITPTEAPPPPEVAPPPEVVTPIVAPTPEIPPLVVTPAPAVPEIPEIPKPEVTPAPEYEPSPEELAWRGEYGDALREWREAKGYGIPEETQAQMMQQATDILKARETESIRVMRNNMESRQITNSGFILANEMTIKSNTTIALANSVTDIQINSALMKMASFEKSMAASAQFLGYLSEQSKLAYAPKLQTWQAEQQATMEQWRAQQNATMAKWDAEWQTGMAEWSVGNEAAMAEWQTQHNTNMAEWNAQQDANMAEWQANYNTGMAFWEAENNATLLAWQGEMDIFKMELNQSYTTENIKLQATLNAEATRIQHAHELLIAEMELEAALEAAKAKGTGSLLGSASGAIATIIAK